MDDLEFDNFTAFDGKVEESAWETSNQASANNDVDNDWANFAQPSTSFQPLPPTSKTLGDLNLRKYSQLIDDRSLLDDLIDEKELVLEDETDEYDEIYSGEPKCLNTSVECQDACEDAFTCSSIWHLYSKVDESPSISHNWGAKSSLIHAYIHQVLNVDENIAQITKSNLPLYAADLALRRPLMPQPIQPTRSLSNDEGRSDISKPPKATIDSLAVEPAEFNWTDSGLANPLTSHSIQANTSMMIDLDFLANKEYEKNEQKKQEKKAHSEKNTPKLKQRQVEDFDVRMLQQDKTQQSIIQEALRVKALRKEQAAKAAVGLPIGRNGVKKPGLVQNSTASTNQQSPPPPKSNKITFQQAIIPQATQTSQSSNLDLLMSNLVFGSK